MKKFKRLIALVLAGVMSLALLTACGSGAALDQQLKENYLEMMDLTARAMGYIGEDETLERDTEMEAKLQKALDNMDENGLIPEEYRPVGDDPSKAVSGEEIHYYEAEQDGYAIVASEADLAEMKREIEQLRTEKPTNPEYEAWKMDGVAVATRVVNGKVYIAMGTRYVLNIQNIPGSGAEQ